MYLPDLLLCKWTWFHCTVSLDSEKQKNKRKMSNLSGKTYLFIKGKNTSSSLREMGSVC